MKANRFFPEAAKNLAETFELYNISVSKDFMMSSVEEEYDGHDDELEFEFNEDEGYVSQMQFLSSKNRKITYEELNVSTEPSLP
ncbi:hypothetical protein GIB67_011940 [Kingdonia uniflora]|uniref:Uncharacterized protein n=1 Tax=Kingdonia uniflora TaxID=39325 RepID=A0A7J7LZW6_9MAGN|nr:hypothetical protein GIB67_011940 [Kingdonia uniflora]